MVGALQRDHRDPGPAGGPHELLHVDAADGAVDDSLGGVELQRLIREDIIESQ